MKLIHTSDIHLSSPLTTRLRSDKVRARKKELMGNFLRLTEEARREGAAGIIIAGDLFDSDKITKKDMDYVITVITGASDLEFFYLPGNHERDVILSAGELPENLHIFGKEWSVFSVGGVTLVGRSETAKDMFSTIPLSESGVNIAVLHGEIRERSGEGGIIGLRDTEDLKLDYVALGHYHSYSEYPCGRGGTGRAVYCGTPEGRGFDEVGEKGYSLINIEGGRVSHRFIPFAKRTLHEIPVDVGGALKTHELEMRILAATERIPTTDIVRALFTGARELELKCNTDMLKERFGTRFYHFEIKDNSKLCTRAEDYRYDKSLRGEFIRLCLEDTSLTDRERELIIHCGLSALAGETYDE